MEAGYISRRASRGGPGNLGKASAVRFDKAAASWNEVLPIGNGRLGAMVFGTVGREQVQLNEESLWYGGFRDRNNPDALRHLEEIRSLIRQGRIKEAERLAFMALPGVPESQRHYQPLGDLFLLFDAGEQGIDEYCRDLDIETATATVRYRQGGVRFTRTYIASAVDQCIVFRLEADSEDALSFRAFLRRGRYLEKTEAENGDSIVLRGYSGGEAGIHFCARLRAVVEGGTLRTVGETIDVRAARSVTLFISASTSFRTMDYEQKCAEWVRRASSRSWDEVLRDHVADYRGLYARVDLELSGDGPERPDDMTTATRLERVNAGGEDPDLVANYFQFGRYLLISSSRPGCLPATLQGIYHLLPALPPAWKSGKVSGLRARGAYGVDIEWKDGKLAFARIRADKGGGPVVHYRDETVRLSMSAGETVRLGGGLERR